MASAAVLTGISYPQCSGHCGEGIKDAGRKRGGDRSLIPGKHRPAERAARGEGRGKPKEAHEVEPFEFRTNGNWPAPDSCGSRWTVATPMPVDCLINCTAPIPPTLSPSPSSPLHRRPPRRRLPPGSNSCSLCRCGRAMDVVGGVIVAAQSGKRGRGMKRTGAVSSCAGECGAWGWSRRVSPRRDGGEERDGYELRSVLGGGQSRTGVGGGGDGGRAGLGRVVKVSSSSVCSSSCSLGFGDHAYSSGSDSTCSLLAPFYRSPINPGFVKPTLAVRSWVDPIQFLLKKELTVTDVGELGRIILPKKDAELHLPHLDSKEGMLLKLEDYNSNKNWTLRYKWWPNNKSRMYVLESTGEFVKYYDLKEKDELILCRDGAGAIVIRGQKWSPSNSLLGTDNFPFRGKNTAKRSPRGPTSRLIAPVSNTAAAAGHTSTVHASTYQAKAMDASSAAAEGADCQLQLGLTPHNSVLVNHSNKMVHPLDCGLLPGASILSTSVLSTSVLTTSVVSHNLVEQIEIGGALVDGYCAHPDGAIDWEKLPDPPAIEFGDPPVIEFPGEFDCSWGDCI